jgi:hypothetical protein
MDIATAPAWKSKRPDTGSCFVGTTGWPPLFEVFCARCEARAWLWASFEIEHMDEAVDPLQAAAVEYGLVDELGQDAVQEIIAEIFGRVRDDN